VKRPIKYFSFWDVPRTFVVESDGKLYLLTSEFDEAVDEYPNEYEVFVIPDHKLSAVSDWKSVALLPTTRIGRVSISSVSFDSTHRGFVDDSFLDVVTALNSPFFVIMEVRRFFSQSSALTSLARRFIAG